ncbi:MAG: terminase gpA endonuclease subunit [Janthinobacterium lividum]
MWAKSDQRRYFVPCRQCSEEAGELAGWQFLDWGGKDTPHGIKWKLDEVGALADVWYAGTCGCVVQEADKAWMDDHGEWRTTNPGGDHPGFHLWTGMSLDVNAAWPVIVKEWLDAQADPATLVQPFVNLTLGRTYRASYGQEIKAGKFLERAEDYGAEVPAWVQYLSLGGDVQSGQNARIEASVYGWGQGLRAALIGHFVLVGDPAEAKVWQALDLLLKRQFRKADGSVMTVRAAAIDSGGHHTAETYAFCNERHKRFVWAIKGRSEVAGRRGNIWPRKPSGKLGSVSYGIGGNAARDWAYGSLAVEKVGPRFVHFPHDAAAGSRPIDVEFFEQLTREKLIVVKGHTEWDKRGVREVGVCWVYAYAAVTGLQAMSGRFVAMGRAPVEAEPLAETASAPAPTPDLVAAGAPSTAPQSPAPTPAPAPQPPRPQPRTNGFLGQRSGGWLKR